MSVVDDIHKLSTAKQNVQADALRESHDRIIKNGKLSVATLEILDVVFSVTGFQYAPVPGGENLACGQLLDTLIEYMTVRAATLTNKTTENANVQITLLKKLIAQCARLYSEVSANLPPEQS